MKIINLLTYKTLKNKKEKESHYKEKIMRMDKAALLEELLIYHEAYQKDPNNMHTTIRAQMIMEVLESKALLTELKELAQEFNYKLKGRLYDQLNAAT